MKHGCPFLNEKHRKCPKNRGGWQAQGAGGGPERGWNGWTGGNACHRLSYSRALIFPDTVLVDASTAGKAPGTLAAADRDILGSAALRLE